MEEAAEIGQAAAKCLRFGMGNHHPERSNTNEDELRLELLDLEATRYLLMQNGVLQGASAGEADRHITRKIKKVKRFMEISRECRTLVDGGETYG
ncbi:MAG: hypothetical protein EOM66_03085 [Clostridia bacterium]|nr:hypothetical protein [Clostridia bacterium]